MQYLRRPRWRLPESAATPETVFWNRRALMRAGVGAAALGVLAGCGQETGGQAQAGSDDWEARLGPKGLNTQAFSPKPAVNPTYADAGRAVTAIDDSGTYNNFYEFSGRTKSIYRAAQSLPTEGWKVKLDGMVEEEKTLDMDDILRIPLEERVVRHRCVERWAMVVPWIGFPISALIERARPLSSAKYVRFESFYLPEFAVGQRSRFYPWPYVEGLTMAEAAHPLSFLVVGAYGRMLPKQFGAPLRIHIPWKYGFKHNKSITRITFTDQRPVGLWEALQASEYGFWANVNPAVPHRRWSQAEEWMLGSREVFPTQLYNGYAEEVAALYANKSDLGDALFR